MTKDNAAYCTPFSFNLYEICLMHFAEQRGCMSGFSSRNAYQLKTILSRPLARAPRGPEDSTAIPAALLLSLKISITCAVCTVSNMLVLNEVLLYCKHLNLFISTTSEEWHSKVYLNKTWFSHSPGWLKMFTPRYF